VGRDMNKKIIVILIVVLIIPIAFYIVNSNQQVSKEPAGFDVQKDNLEKEEMNTTETALKKKDNRNTGKDERNIEVEENNKFPQEYTEENMDTGEEIDNTKNTEEASIESDNETNTSKSDENETVDEIEIQEESTLDKGISYSSETGIQVEGEIDFDMSLEKEISGEDKIEAIKYAAKLDIPYLLGLISDGIDEDDKVLVSEHLRERLEEEEYDKTKNLIVKYLYLLK